MARRSGEVAARQVGSATEDCHRPAPHNRRYTAVATSASTAVAATSSVAVVVATSAAVVADAPLIITDAVLAASIATAKTPRQ